MINDIDINWIDEFDKYDIFYKDKNSDINFTYIYTSRPIKQRDDKYDSMEVLPMPEIYKIKKELIKLKKENIISKEELIFNINKNKEDTKLISIGLYNNKDDINNIKSSNIINNPNELIREINYLDDILLEDTINYLKTLNSIIIIFYKKNYKYINIGGVQGFSAETQDVISKGKSRNRSNRIKGHHNIIKKQSHNSTKKIKIKVDKD